MGPSTTLQNVSAWPTSVLRSERERTRAQNPKTDEFEPVLRHHRGKDVAHCNEKMAVRPLSASHCIQFPVTASHAKGVAARQEANQLRWGYVMQLFHHWFTVFAKWTAHKSGQPVAFAAAVAIVLIWAITGPVFNYSDTWQLVINTGTTIVTFLMVFLIQNTQNRDTGAVQTKLDELIRAIEGAHNALLDLEELDEAEIEHIRRDYRRLAASARKAIAKGMQDTDCAELEK